MRILPASLCPLAWAASGLNFLDFQKKASNFNAGSWPPRPHTPVLILLAWSKMEVSDRKPSGNLLLTFLASLA